MGLWQKLVRAQGDTPHVGPAATYRDRTPGEGHTGGAGHQNGTQCPSAVASGNGRIQVWLGPGSLALAGLMALLTSNDLGRDLAKSTKLEWARSPPSCALRRVRKSCRRAGGDMALPAQGGQPAQTATKGAGAQRAESNRSGVTVPGPRCLDGWGTQFEPLWGGHTVACITF